MILLYIDPGTGSMLFSVILGVLTASYFAFRKLWIKVKTTALGGRAEKIDREKIPVVIFSDSKRYWTTFEPICNELDKRGIRCEYWTESEDDPAFTTSFENITCRFIGNLNKAITKLNIMNARICLSTTPGLDVYQWKRSKDTDLYVHVYHSVSTGLEYRLFGVDHYDTILLSGDFIEETIRKLEEMRHLNAKKFFRAGLPYLDRMKKEVASRHFEKNNTTTVLLAPTWGSYGLLSTWGDELIDALIATGYNIIVRPHPQSYTSEESLIKRLRKKYPENDLFHWNDDNDNIAVLGSSDIMISDYSGVVYDFTMIFNKPVIYSLAEFNKDPYDACYFDELPKMISILPEFAFELKKENLSDMKRVIDDAIQNKTKATARDYVKEHLWYDHGKSAENIADYIENELLMFETTEKNDLKPQEKD